MSKKAAEHHKKAAEHHTQAARHHPEAAKHHEAGHHEKAAHHAHTARGHVVHARGHAEELRRRTPKSTVKNSPHYRIRRTSQRAPNNGVYSSRSACARRQRRG